MSPVKANAGRLYVLDYRMSSVPTEVGGLMNCGCIGTWDIGHLLISAVVNCMLF